MIGESLDQKGIYAPIRKIIPFSVVDGPGNRIAIFFQGCNLSCRYCHNPETKEIVTFNRELKAPLEYDSELKGECKVSTKGEEFMMNLDDEIRWMEVSELVDEIEDDLMFVRGVTLSGGECMLQPEFIKGFLYQMKKRKVDTLIDSNGSINFREFPDIVENCQGVMLDIKAWSDFDYKDLTGSTDQVRFDNIKYLLAKDRLYELRLVCYQPLEKMLSIITELKNYLGNEYLNLSIKLIPVSWHHMKVVDDNEKVDTQFMKSIKSHCEILGFTNTHIS